MTYIIELHKELFDYMVGEATLNRVSEESVLERRLIKLFNLGISTVETILVTTGLTLSFKSPQFSPIGIRAVIYTLTIGESIRYLGNETLIKYSR